MSGRIAENLDQCWQFSRKWFRCRGMEFVRCRQCGDEVRFLEDICPHCGASSPARVAPSLLVLVAGVIAVALVAANLF